MALLLANMQNKYNFEVGVTRDLLCLISNKPHEWPEAALKPQAFPWGTDFKRLDTTSWNITLPEIRKDVGSLQSTSYILNTRYISKFIYSYIIIYFVISYHHLFKHGSLFSDFGFRFRFTLFDFIFTGWARKKFPLLKIHSTKITPQIWIIQILVRSRKIEVFLWFFSLSYQH